MYNRYIPQPDGTFQRNRVPDPRPQPRHAPPPPQHDAPCEPSSPVQPPRKEHKKCPQQRTSGSDGFLKQLLPKDFDTGDLIVILLLLLMAGDCEEDRNNALLTIALYFMM